ncbi:hypothetical protein HC762_01850 [bacterium]|nr:hypothetical protein [bacterium]
MSYAHLHIAEKSIPSNTSTTIISTNRTTAKTSQDAKHHPRDGEECEDGEDGEVFGVTVVVVVAVVLQAGEPNAFRVEQARGRMEFSRRSMKNVKHLRARLEA